MVPYGACFHFIGLFCYKALTVKVEKTYKETLFRRSSCKMPKVKNYLLVNIYFIYRYLKIEKNRVTRLFFKLEAFKVILTPFYTKLEKSHISDQFFSRVYVLGW